MCCRGCGDFVTLLTISRNFSEISKFSIFVKKIPGIRIHIAIDIDDFIVSWSLSNPIEHLEELEGGNIETFFMRKLLVLGDIEERRGEHPSPPRGTILVNVIFNYPGRLNNNNPLTNLSQESIMLGNEIKILKRSRQLLQSTILKNHFSKGHLY